jgi:PPK2 family polyphosphate:nucleotide phosphotransferase
MLSISEINSSHQVAAGADVDLSSCYPTFLIESPDKRVQCEKLLASLNRSIHRLQTWLCDAKAGKVLIVLQAMDAGGKDGVIRHFREAIRVHEGVRESSFKKPTDEELAHDFLWRIHKETPRNGEIGFFNRSHYEDVVAARVKSLVPQEVWMNRYKHIRSFEQMLVNEGTTILKFFLNISRDEQERRFTARKSNPELRRLHNPEDIGESAKWNEYMLAYKDTFRETSTELAPWYVIPANDRMYRNLVVCMLVENALLKIEAKQHE